VPIPLVGVFALLGRIVGLGLERPWVKALGRERGSIAATTLSFGLAVLLITPIVVWQYATGSASFADIPRWIGPGCISGLLYAVGFHSYVYGLSRGEVSYLTPLYATAFIWLYALDVLFGGATLALRPVLGIAAVTAGIVFLTPVGLAPGLSPAGRLGRQLNPLTLLHQPGAWGMLTYAFCLATGRIIDHSVSGVAPPVPYAWVGNLPAILFGLAWLATRRELGQLGALLRERPVPAIGSAFVGISAYILLLVSFSAGIHPSVAEPISQLSVFISIWLGGRWFGEPVRARWLPAVLVVAGAALLVL